MLDAFGFDVIYACDGQTALELFGKDPDGIDLVLLDLTMPNMDGEETFRNLRKVREDVKVILSSGYNEKETLSRFAGKGLADFIQKPYSPKTLMEKVKRLLDQ